MDNVKTFIDFKHDFGYCSDIGDNVKTFIDFKHDFGYCSDIGDLAKTEYYKISTDKKKKIEFEIQITSMFQYKEIIFNNPATIVFWADGTKTVVKCGKNDIFDPEKGIALCFMKRALKGKSGAMNKILHKETDKYKEKDDAK